MNHQRSHLMVLIKWYNKKEKGCCSLSKKVVFQKERLQAGDESRSDSLESIVKLYTFPIDGMLMLLWTICGALRRMQTRDEGMASLQDRCGSFSQVSWWNKVLQYVCYWNQLADLLACEISANLLISASPQPIIKNFTDFVCPCMYLWVYS